MSYPRHSVIWKDCEKRKWWLDIALDIDPDRCTSRFADTIGEFDSKEDAIEFLDNFPNIGFETPILDPDIFWCLAYPDQYIRKEDITV